MGGKEEGREGERKEVGREGGREEVGRKEVGREGGREGGSGEGGRDSYMSWHFLDISVALCTINDGTNS